LLSSFAEHRTIVPLPGVRIPTRSFFPLSIFSGRCLLIILLSFFCLKCSSQPEIRIISRGQQCFPCLENDQSQNQTASCYPEGQMIAVKNSTVHGGDDRGNHGSKVDPHIIDIKAGILKFWLIFVDIADHDRHVDFENTGANSDQKKSD